MGVLEQVTAVATIIIAIVLMVLAVLAAVSAWRLRGLERRVSALLDQTRDDVIRLVQNGQTASENLAFVTSAIRADVHKVNALVDTTTDRMHDAIAVTERHLDDFNALVSVARAEAEELFVSAASTVRGVQRGARALRRRGGPDLASNERDAASSADDTTIQEEEGDGDDSDAESAAQAVPAAPRIRPRRATRRQA